MAWMDRLSTTPPSPSGKANSIPETRRVNSLSAHHLGRYSISTDATCKKGRSVDITLVTLPRGKRGGGHAVQYGRLTIWRSDIRSVSDSLPVMVSVYIRLAVQNLGLAVMTTYCTVSIAAVTSARLAQESCLNTLGDTSLPPRDIPRVSRGLVALLLNRASVSGGAFVLSS